MKKILLLLLLATFSIQAQTLQNPTYGNVKLKNNTTDNSATKVNVQSTDGTINTISKFDLVNVVEVNDVPSLPLVGEVGKIYVVKNINKIYRWNGTFYQELAGSDISGLQAQIDLKANDSDVLHKTGNETKTGNLSIIGTVSVKSANPKGSFHVFTGTSGNDIDMVGQENGSISFSNSGGSTASPAITSKSNDANGLTILTGTNNTNPLYDMGFQVSENDNTDFSTLTTKSYLFKRHNTELFSIYRNGKSEFLNQVKSTGGNFIVGTNSETGIASFYNNKNVTQHADYGFLEDSDLNYSGVGLQGHASFADNLKISGIQDSDHHNSFQAYPYYQNSGTITYLKGFFMQPSVTAGTVTNLFEFEANDPIGVGGTITNLHGVHIRELTKGTNNYAFFSEGATPSFIGGTYLGNSKVGIGGTITPTANLEVIDSNQTASGDGNVTIRTTDSQASDKGGLLTFGGSYSGTSRTIFGGISGRKENSTNGNIAGYLSLYSSNPTLGLVEGIRLKSSGVAEFYQIPTAPTAPAGTNTTQIATTAFVLENAGVTSTGTTNRIPKFTSSNSLGDSGLIQVGGNIGMGSAVVPGELFHIGDGNILLEGGGEVAQKFKRDFTTTGENLGVPTGSGISVNPIFQVGRIIQAGDGDPEIRIMYSDDNTSERTVFEVDRKGIAASVKTSIGSHFEGFASLTDVNPKFRLNSYPRMRLEMGAGGNDITDVAVERGATGSLDFFTNSAYRGGFDSSGNLNLLNTPTAPTAPAGTNTTQIATTAFVLENSSARPYKVYTALLTQSGTNAPVATVLENNLGTVNFTRSSNGVYLVNSSGLFTADKTFVIMGAGTNAAYTNAINLINSSAFSIVTKLSSTQSDTDSANTKVAFEIRVYN